MVPEMGGGDLMVLQGLEPGCPGPAWRSTPMRAFSRVVSAAVPPMVASTVHIGHRTSGGDMEGSDLPASGAGHAAHYAVAAVVPVSPPPLLTRTYLIAPPAPTSSAPEMLSMVLLPHRPFQWSVCPSGPRPALFAASAGVLWKDLHHRHGGCCPHVRDGVAHRHRVAHTGHRASATMPLVQWSRGSRSPERCGNPARLRATLSWACCTAFWASSASKR